MAELSTWIQASFDLEAIYRDELGRSVYSDQEAFVNWAWHRLDRGESLNWIRERIRESQEWREKHPGDSPAPSPHTPPVVTIEPPLEAGRVYQVTGPTDGTFHPRFYSYWSNAFIRDGSAFVFAGHVDGRPRFFRVDLETGGVERLGALVGYGGTAEGWYWDRRGRLMLCDGPRLRRIDPFGRADDVVLDISDTHPGCRLWQAHSSDDGLVHSATVERITTDGPYQRIGTVASRPGWRTVFPSFGVLDESQVDRSGAYLIIKEDHDNRIITLATGETRTIRNAEGALGHSDCGHGFIVGEDDQIGACVWIDLQDLSDLRLFSTWNMGYVSVRGDRCLLSDRTHLSLVALDGSGVTPVVAHGMVGEGYDFQVKANLDPTGRIACYMSNQGTGRFDVFLVGV